MSYTKLFSSIVTSTIWTEDSDICKVWVTMLAIADRHGEVHASIPGLAQIAALPLATVELAIGKFLSPDPYSRTKDDEGRRIEEIDGGWLILNHSKYRAMASKDEQKAAAAERQARFRARQKRNGIVTESNASVTHRNASVTQDRDIAEAEAEADTESTKLALQPVQMDPTENQPHGARAEMLAIAGKIQGLRDAWKLPLTYAEMQSLMGVAGTADALTDDDWKTIRSYLHARLPQGTPGWQPRSRSRFIESLADVYGHAVEWSRKQGTTKPKGKGAGWK